MEKKDNKKKGGKVKVTTKKKELTLSQLKTKGVNILDEDYLTEDERLIFTRIKGKLIRSWKMSVNEFLDANKNKEIFIYPYSSTKVHWELNGKKYIRGYAE